MYALTNTVALVTPRLLLNPAGHICLLCRVLHSGLFHCIRDKPHLLSKVCLLKGDLLMAHPNLGIPEVLPPSQPSSALAEGPIWDTEGKRVRLGCMADLRAAPRLLAIHCAARWDVASKYACVEVNLHVQKIAKYGPIGTAAGLLWRTLCV